MQGRTAEQQRDAVIAGFPQVTLRAEARLADCQPPLPSSPNCSFHIAGPCMVPTCVPRHTVGCQIERAHHPCVLLLAGEPHGVS